MATTAFKRYRMEIDLRGIPAVPDLPLGYKWVSWNDVWLETHAEVTWRSFQSEIDTIVFPNLSRYHGCLALMQAIRDRADFSPEATWLIVSLDRYCGSIQGLSDPTSALGAVQNLGVVPQFRGLGLGKALLMKALHGYRELGMTRAFLEVTARNLRAVRLYHALGFQIRRTLYREVVLPETEYSI